MLNCFKVLKSVFTFSIISWNFFNRRRTNTQWSNLTRCLSYTNMPADDLATLGANAPSSKLLTPKDQYHYMPSKSRHQKRFTLLFAEIYTLCNRFMTGMMPMMPFPGQYQMLHRNQLWYYGKQQITISPMKCKMTCFFRILILIFTFLLSYRIAQSWI